MQISNSIKFGLIILGCCSAYFIAYVIEKYVGYISINVSPSLPQKVFLVSRDTSDLKVGNLIVFPRMVDGNYKELIKIVAGVSGDRVTIKDKSVYINAKKVGILFDRKRNGKKLTPIEDITIPQDKYFAWTPKLTSCDSRYQEIGLISHKEIIGKGYLVDWTIFCVIGVIIIIGLVKFRMGKRNNRGGGM